MAAEEGVSWGAGGGEGGEVSAWGGREVARGIQPEGSSMMKKTKARLEMNYTPKSKHVMPMCGTCSHVVFENRKHRCSIGGFIIRMKGVCDRWSLKDEQ